MTTIEELAETIRSTRDLDTLDAAREVVTVHVDQIRDDEDLWNEDTDTLTDAGVEVIEEAIAVSYALGLRGTTAQRLLDDIADAAAAIAKAEQEVVEHTELRDELIRQALKTEIPRGDIAAAAEVKPARLYQIRDGRR